MDYTNAIRKINASQNRNCFVKPIRAEIDYLKGLNLPKEVLDFYNDFAPADIIEINAIRLLPISEVVEENTNYIPGYLLTPLGFCVIATTIEGDVYCINNTSSLYNIVIASHDEIYEGQEVDEILKGTRQIADTLNDFLNLFAEQKLNSSFYSPEH